MYTIAQQREILRGSEAKIFDLVASTAEKDPSFCSETKMASRWAKWLKLVLDSAAYIGDSGLTKKLLRAGTSGNPLLGAIRGHHEGPFVRELLQLGASPSDSSRRFGCSLIEQASALGQDQTVLDLIDHGADTDVLDKFGRSALHVAAMRGHVSVVKTLLAAGTKTVNIRCGKDGWSALDYAAKNGHTNVLRALIEHGGVDVKAANSEGTTALHRAWYSNDSETVNVLVKAGAYVNAESKEGWTPLHRACEKQDSESTVLALLRHGACKDKLLEDGRSPLHLASEQGFLSSAKALLAADADANLRFGINESSAMDLAAEYGHIEILEAFIECGADVNAVDSDGFSTALYAASSGNQVDAIGVLLEAGADIHAKGDFCGLTPLHAACKENRSDAVVALLEHGADADRAMTFENRRPLHVAAEYGSTAAVNALLAVGVEIEISADKEPPLHSAARGGNVDIVTALIEHGADVNRDSREGRTALHCAVFCNRVGVIEVLLDAGADIEAQLKLTGWSPLHIAVDERYRESAEALLKRDANINAPDNLCEAPLHTIAKQCGEKGAFDMAELLLKWGINETTRNSFGATAKDLVRFLFASLTYEDDRSTRDADDFVNLLQDSPADRAWRRRSLVVLCRTYPHRLRIQKDRSQAKYRRASRKAVQGRSRAGIETEPKEGGRDGVEKSEHAPVCFGTVFVGLFALKEDAVFRQIVMFL